MKKIIFLLVISLFLTGCFNYRDVNRIVFVTALCIDIDEHNNPVLYAEVFRPMRAPESPGGKEHKEILTGTGDTVFDAIRNLTATSAVKVNYTQNKAVIFSERAAEYGLNHFLDVLFRDQELLARQYLFISKVDSKELVKIKITEEDFLGTFLFELAETKPGIAKNTKIRIDEFYIQRKLGSQVNTMSIIDHAPNPFQERVILAGLAVLDQDTLIGELDREERLRYNIIINNLGIGHFNIPNPDVPDKLLTFEIVRSRTKTHVQYDGGNVVDVTKDVNLRVTLAEVQEEFNIGDLSVLRPSKRDMAQKIAAEKLKKECMDLYERFKEEDIDIFNLKRAVDIKYPNAPIDNDKPLDSIKLNINVKVFIEGSSNVFDFY